MERDAYGMLHMMMRNPKRYCDLVLNLDDANLTREEFSESIRSTVQLDEWSMLQMLSEITHHTPGEDGIQFARWRRNGVIYVVDSTAAHAIVDTDWGNIGIPGEVLRRLPHPDPMIVLPWPISWMNTDGFIERYEMFGVFGVRQERRRCSTHHPDVEQFTLHFFGKIIDPVSGKQVKTEVTSISGSTRVVRPIVGMRALTPLDSDSTMKEREQIAAQDMQNAGDSAMMGFSSVDEAVAGVQSLIRLGLAILVYIVTDEADTQLSTTRHKGRRKASHHVAHDSLKTFEVGFRVGAALRQASSDAERDSRSTSATSTRTVAPHIRRAHLHTFRRGPGRTEKFLKWLGPIAVGTREAQGRKRPPTQVHII